MDERFTPCAQVCQLLIEAKANVNGGALHGAAGCGDMEACQLLIEAKADVNAKRKCALMFESCC
jgi:hypothetical protein